MRSFHILFGLCFVKICLSSPIELSDGEEEQNVEENEIGNADYDVFESLQQVGERVFGTPKASTGAKLSKWTPDSKVFPEEMGEYLEGDILHPAPTTKNGLRAQSSRWPNRTIPYEFSPYISMNDRMIILSAIEDYHKYTCLKLRPRTFADRDYVFFTSDNTGCWSSVGRIGGRQEINLQSPGCLTQKGTVIHEILHAVGFMHEQNRPDRDKYVQVLYNNIEWGRELNFERARTDTVDNQGVGYDYRSVMHYSSHAFSRNGMPTILPRVRGVVLGQREGFTEKDIMKVQIMYKCKVGKDASSDA